MMLMELVCALAIEAAAPPFATSLAASSASPVSSTPPAPTSSAVSSRASMSWTPPISGRPGPLPARWVLAPGRLLTRGEIAADQPGDGGGADTNYYLPRIGPGDEPIEIEPIELVESESWLRSPLGDQLLVDPALWRSQRSAKGHGDLHFDYNRVDQLRFGASTQLQEPYSMRPRLGVRLEYATGRKRTLYGVQFEQPLVPPGRLAIGGSMVRRTGHHELQQVDDLENSLALLFGRQDYRDYFESEGGGAYLSWRVPDFSTVSMHWRAEDFRSLGVNRGTRSWFQRSRTLRDNPAIDDGTQRSALVRLERLAQTTSRTRAGLYHWLEVERAGAGLGGDFEFTRALADVRSVLRLTPATTLSLRAVGGHTAAGALPRQRKFPVGGVDGLRAHAFSQYLGDQMLLMQAEYDIGLWRLHSDSAPNALHALVFVDAGRAWQNPAHRWDVGRQQLQADGGFGLASADDALRIYFAKNLQKLGSDFVISMRLQRPF
ncbi:MAG: BamA/TamA family outer membrane protein [Candidatus Eisenbacteria bacterium]